MHRWDGNPQEDKVEINFDIELINNLFHDKLGLPYSTKYEKFIWKVQFEVINYLVINHLVCQVVQIHQKILRKFN